MAAQHFNYAFIHYRDTDSAGHAFGWGSGTYQQAVAAVDKYLADVLHLIDSDPKLAGHTAVIVSSDHGGLERITAIRRCKRISRFRFLCGERE